MVVSMFFLVFSMNWTIFSLFLHWFFYAFSLIFQCFFLDFSMLFNLGDMAPGAMSPAPEHVTAWHAQFDWVFIAFSCVRSLSHCDRLRTEHVTPSHAQFHWIFVDFFSFPYGNLNHLNENRRFLICWAAGPSKYCTFFPGPLLYIHFTHLAFFYFFYM